MIVLNILVWLKMKLFIFSLFREDSNEIDIFHNSRLALNNSE